MKHHVRVAPIPAWVDAPRLLGPGDWALATGDGGVVADAVLESGAAADVKARLRNLGLAGRPVEVEIAPPLKRAVVRAALTEDARRRRDTTPGFTRAGYRLDDEGRISLSPEALALALGERFAGATVLDAGCGAGGDAIGFARAGCAVTAVERDAERLRMAAHNARLYGVDDRIEFVRGDAETEAARRSADVLFADPPWGPEWDRRRTELDDLPLLSGLLRVFATGGYGQLVVKVPPSFDPSTVPGASAEAVFGVAAGDYRRVKYVLLVLRRA